MSAQMSSVDQAIERAVRAKAVPKGSFKRTELSPGAPAPRTKAITAKEGADTFKSALAAWDKRLAGTPIVDVAHQLGCSIEAAKELIREAHAAIADDLKEALELNRSLDLARIDGLLSSYYPQACQGELNSAHLVLKCLAHRAKLTGIEPQPTPGRSSPENVLIWIQNQMPQINKIVDALPLDALP